jgi:hypothetical protein
VQDLAPFLRRRAGDEVLPVLHQINPCRGVVDDDKVRKNHLTLPSPQEGAVAVRLLF